MTDHGTAVTRDTLRIERLLPGPIERVWRYLTDPALRATWLAGGTAEPQAGGAIELVFRNSELTQDDDPPPEKYAHHAEESRLRGQVTDCRPPNLLAFSWGDSDEASHVRFELEAIGDDVRLVVIHSRLATRDAMLAGLVDDLRSAAARSAREP